MQIETRPLAEIKPYRPNPSRSYTKLVRCPCCLEYRIVRRDSKAQFCKPCASRIAAQAPKPLRIRGEVRQCAGCGAGFWHRPSDRGRQFCCRACANAARRRSDSAVRAKARWTANNAIRDGMIQRRPCEVCGAPRAQAHHADYSAPLSIRWLCRTCHWEHHRSIGDLKSQMAC